MRHRPCCVRKFCATGAHSQLYILYMSHALTMALTCCCATSPGLDRDDPGSGSKLYPYNLRNSPGYKLSPLM